MYTCMESQPKKIFKRHPEIGKKTTLRPYFALQKTIDCLFFFVVFFRKDFHCRRGFFRIRGTTTGSRTMASIGCRKAWRARSRSRFRWFVGWFIPTKNQVFSWPGYKYVFLMVFLRDGGCFTFCFFSSRLEKFLHDKARVEITTRNSVILVVASSPFPSLIVVVVAPSKGITKENEKNCIVGACPVVMSQGGGDSVPYVMSRSDVPPHGGGGIVPTGHHGTYGTSLRDITTLLRDITGHTSPPPLGTHGTSLRDITTGHHYGTSLRDTIPPPPPPWDITTGDITTGHHYGTLSPPPWGHHTTGHHYGTSLRDITMGH